MFRVLVSAFPVIVHLPSNVTTWWSLGAQLFTVEITYLRKWLLCCNVFEVWVQISTGQGFWNVWFISSVHGKLSWASGALGRFVLLISVVSSFSLRLCSSEMPQVRLVLNDGHLQGPRLKENFLAQGTELLWFKGVGWGQVPARVLWKNPWGDSWW